MKTSEILSAKVTTINVDVCTTFFNKFAKHYKLTNDQIKKAWSNFEELSSMDITLEIAIATAIAFAKF